VAPKFPGFLERRCEEFIRRFLLHVLPDGFQRIRYYGFLGNRYREQKLAHCRELLGMPTPEPPALETAKAIVSAMKNLPALRCGSAQSVAKAACW
jgi:Putative transposase